MLREDGFAVDLTLHGGAFVVASVLALAERDGFVRSPVDVETIGSTDARSIFEHEVLVSLPMARTELAARMLLAQPQAWSRIAGDADRVPILADRSLEQLLHPPTLAIVGLPNAGKSTLANRLFGRQRSIVSPIEGTTRDWVGEEANIDGLVVKLIDTPGLRASQDAIEQQAIAQSRGVVERADLTLVLLDATGPIDDRRPLLDRFPKAIVALNKIDATASEPTSHGRDLIRISAEQGTHIGQLIDCIHRHFGLRDRPVEAPRVWTRRQREAVQAGDLRPVCDA